MKRRGILFKILLLGLFLALFNSICAAKAPHSGKDQIQLDINIIETIIEKVKYEYVDNVKQIILVNGAIKGINQLLKENKLEPLLLINKDFPEKKQTDALMGYLNKIITEHPQIEKKELIAFSISGMLNALDDPYTKYLTANDYAKMLEQMEGGNFGGIGIYIEINPKTKILTVLEPIEDTPAYKAGLKYGDKIIKVDGKSTEGIKIEGAQAILRGPVGSKVTLTVEDASDNTIRELTLERAFIHVKSVEYKVIDNNLGYIKLKIFGEETSRELEEALMDFEKKGIRGYIVDLRNNGGGYISTAVEVSSKFLPSVSSILYIEGKNVTEANYKSFPNFRIHYPVVILVNQYSASASEIVAGAFQDSKYGKIIGARTFGKASVQSIHPLLDGSAIKITTARYLTPKKRNLNKVGLLPDIVVNMDPLKIEKKDEDIQLKKAVDFLNIIVKSKFGGTAQHENEKYFAKAFSLYEEYELLKNEGNLDDFEIKRHILINRGGKFCDLIQIEDKRTKETRTFIFDITDYLKS